MFKAHIAKQNARTKKRGQAYRGGYTRGVLRRSDTSFHSEPTKSDLQLSKLLDSSSDDDDSTGYISSDRSIKEGKNISIQASISNTSACSVKKSHSGSITLIDDRATPSSSRADSTDWSSLVDKINSANENTMNKNYIAELLGALYDSEVRNTLSQIFLEPMLNRVRDLEVQQAKTDKKVKKLESTNKILEDKCAKLEKQLESVKDNTVQNDISLKPIEKEITNIKHKANINMRMNDQDRRNNLVIIGIQENVTETQEEVEDKVKTILQKASIKLEGSFTASRLGKQNSVEEKDREQTGFMARWMGNKAQKNRQEVQPRPRPVKICLTSQYDKHNIYRARISMKDTNNAGIFINEDLPKVQQTLLMHCRNARRQNKLISQWTEDGVVHIRTKDKDDIIVTDLQFLKNETGYREQ